MPAGHIDTGNTIFDFDFASAEGGGRNDVPSETGEGVGVSGVLKGCAALVEVAGAGAGEGDAAPERRELLFVKERKDCGVERMEEADARCRQREQIIEIGGVGIDWGGVVVEFESSRYFLEVVRRAEVGQCGQYQIRSGLLHFKRI